MSPRNEWWGRRDSNPGHGLPNGSTKLEPTSIRQIELSKLWSLYKETFEVWLYHQKGELETKRRILSALNRFFDSYNVTTFAELEEALMLEDYKRNFAQGLRKFIAFLKVRGIIDRGTYEDLKEVIKLRPTKARKIRPSDEHIRFALNYYQKRDPILGKLYKTLVFSGLRLKHVVMLYNNFDPAELEIRGNIAKYPLEEFSRGNKRVFIAYLPRDFAETELERLNLDYDKIRGRMQVRLRAIREKKEKTKYSPSAAREWFSTFLARQGVPREVINFIQGRVEEGILEKHYLDLEILADEWYSAVVEDLKLVLEGGFRSKRKRLGISLRDERR